MEYLPFGEVWIEDVDPATRYIPFRFTSKELDKETGLYYYGARYYEPKVSRWMSADPAGFALVNPNRGGYSVIEATNWYAYVANNPVKYVDPTGEWRTKAERQERRAVREANREFRRSQRKLNRVLRKLGYKSTRLGRHVDTDEMAKLFKDYSELLDTMTADFVNSTEEDALSRILSRTKVFVLNADDMKIVKDAMKLAGVPSYEDTPDGIGFGNSIYIKKDAFEKDTKGDLLGHEAVHILQTNAYGGLGGMFEAYGNDMKGMEKTAYEFGGYHRKYSEDTQREEADLPPVFQEHPIRRR